MEGKSQNLMVVLIAVAIAVAVFSSFGRDMFSGGVPAMTPPPSMAVETPEPTEDTGDGDLIRVSVTPETVQSVIATLSRPASYHRDVTVEYADAGGTVYSRMWVDDGWTKTDTSLPGGLTRHSIVGEGKVYYWYGGGHSWATAPADERSADLEGPHIPTYEDILDLPVEHITAADYTELNGLPCIHVAAEDRELGSITHYWVGEENGLLMAARRLAGGSEVLTMTSSAVERPVEAKSVFALPDGRPLHIVQG